jgi:hypothetical protein
VSGLRNTVAKFLDLSLSVVSCPQNQAASILPSTSKVTNALREILRKRAVGGEWKLWYR